MSDASEKRRWTPVRRGRKYCSPGCGRGCTHAEYTKALRLGHDLAKRLGKGWKCHVWENLGWHYLARKGKCDVYQYIHGTRYYWFNFQSVRQFEFYANTLEEGKRKLRQAVIEDASGMLTDLHALEAT